jgi:hypothetical protein
MRPRPGHMFTEDKMGIKHSKFSPRQITFLELYLSGFLMKDAARAAGYRGSSDQALCNTARKILDKFSTNPKALFRLAGVRERKIAQLLVDMADNSKSAFQQLKALTILSKCFGG